MSNLVEVKVEKSLGQITSNLEAVEANVREIANEYMGMVITEDNLIESKKMRADLNKMRTSLENDRKAIKKEWNKPYDEFEKKVKNIVCLYDTALSSIDGRLNQFEEDRKEKKRQIIYSIFESVASGEEDVVKDYVTLERIYNSKWENATFKEKDIESEIKMEFDKVSMEISTIKSIDSKFEDKGLEEYKLSHDIQSAIRIMNEYRKREEEIIARQEAERKAREERERIEAERKAEQERIAAERKAEQERIEAERKAEQERIAAERKAEQERIEAERKAEQVNQFEELPLEESEDEEKAFELDEKFVESSDDDQVTIQIKTDAFRAEEIKLWLNQQNISYEVIG